MFRSASLFIGTSFTVTVFTIFATSNVDSIVGIPHKIYSMQSLIHIKKPISLLNVPICTQGMQRTWWPEASTIIVTGPYCEMRCSSHMLEIERGRHTSPKTLVAERKCPICKGIDDEKHFVLECQINKSEGDCFFSTLVSIYNDFMCLDANVK